MRTCVYGRYAPAKVCEFAIWFGFSRFMQETPAQSLFSRTINKHDVDNTDMGPSHHLTRATKTHIRKTNDVLALYV